MLEPKTRNIQIEPTEEVNTVPNLSPPKVKSLTPHGKAKTHHKKGRHPVDRFRDLVSP